MSVRGSQIRERALDELTAHTFDVLVIGGGIVGARAALEAARAGLRAALVEAGDFGGGTSSTSGKLIHAGLRYLRSGNVQLVRQAHRERRILTNQIAPHLVHRLPLLLATAEHGLARLATIAAGPLAYWALDGLRSPAPRFFEEPGPLLPALQEMGSGTFLEEAVTDDARLTLATVKAAVRAGAVAVNHARVVELQSSGRGVSRAKIETREDFFEVRCWSVINATGPWLDHIRLLQDPKRRPAIRLSKGVHLALSLDDDWPVAIAHALDSKSHAYAVPWHGMLLLGTTDTVYEGDPSSVAPEADDEASLLDAASRFLPGEMLEPERVRCSFAGLRVLPPGDGTTSDASRDHIIRVDPGGMVSVGGGKLTTHRIIALDALRNLPTRVRPRRLRPTLDPLPGASVPDMRVLRTVLDEPVAEHLVRLYGGEAGLLLRYTAHGDALERIHPASPDIWAQAYHAADEEWAITVEDIVRRRTTLGIRGTETGEVEARLATVLHRGFAIRRSTAMDSSVSSAYILGQDV